MPLLFAEPPDACDYKRVLRYRETGTRRPTITRMEE